MKSQEWHKYRKMRKTADTLFDAAELFNVDPVDLGVTILSKQAEFCRIGVLLPIEKRFKLLHKLVNDTVRKTKKGEITHPLRCIA